MRGFYRPAVTLPIAIAVALTFHRPTAADQSADRSQPNIVFILIDDLGWCDVGCYGNTIYDTPNIDRLATEGMRFTNGYAACNCCSPTRGSILSGKYPARTRLTDWIPGSSWPWTKLRSPGWTKYLPLEEVTIAEALKTAGYVTGHVGKWHLGGDEYRPQAQGFDYNFGGCDRGAPGSYFYPYRVAAIKDGRPNEFLTERLTDEALGFIEANRDRPFFLYLSHYTVHRPLQAPPALVQKYLDAGRPATGPGNATFAAMVESMDTSVGRVLDGLDRLGIEDNTVVFFMSDNGGLARKLNGPADLNPKRSCVSSTSNAPLRGGKGSVYEGGIREPWIVKWPGVVRPGSTCDTPVTSVDFYPTILAMTGTAAAPSHLPDGLSTVPLLKQSPGFQRKSIYWHYPHYNICGEAGTRPHGIIRQGRYKLLLFYEDDRVELYDLESDIGEKDDLADRMPQKAAQLRADLQAWLLSVDAQMPVANPQYDPEKADKIYTWWQNLPTR